MCSQRTERRSILKKLLGRVTTGGITSNIRIDRKRRDAHVKNYGSVGCDNTKPLARDQLYGSATIDVGTAYKDKDRGSVGQSAEQEDS